LRKRGQEEEAEFKKNMCIGVSLQADLFSSTLSCNKKEEKNHQTSHFARAPFNQSSNFERAPFNQSSNFERAALSIN
jgi:hypothetical protein